MKASDLIIIYLACGSPLGVYYFTRPDSHRSLASAAWAMISFLIWPISAIVVLRGRMAALRPSAEAILDRNIGELRTAIENVAFPKAGATPVFEFRDVFGRFTGLARELMHETDNSNSNSNEIFAVSGHENARLGSACLGRRNRERLRFHLMRARNEFVETVSNLFSDETKATRLIELASDLAILLDDRETFDDLQALLIGPAFLLKSRKVKYG